MICEEEDKGNALREFLEYSASETDMEIAEIPEYFTHEEIQMFTRNCGQMLRGILRKIIAEKLPKQEFYTKLWEKVIIENGILSEEKEKIFALYFIWKDDRIPYFDVSSGLKMSNEEFNNIRECKEELLKKASFVLSTNFSQKTQRSSVLLEIIDECENDKERAVILAHSLDVAEKKVAEKILESIQKGV